LPPNTAPPASGCPPAFPTVTAAGGGVSHPARSYGASWRSTAADEHEQPVDAWGRARLLAHRAGGATARCRQRDLLCSRCARATCLAWRTPYAGETGQRPDSPKVTDPGQASRRGDRRAVGGTESWSPMRTDTCSGHTAVVGLVRSRAACRAGLAAPTTSLQSACWECAGSRNRS
jgi:hypothetical protein